MIYQEPSETDKDQKNGVKIGVRKDQKQIFYEYRNRSDFA